MKQLLLVGEEFQLIDKRHGLRKDRGCGCSADTPMKDEDEEDVERDVHQHCEDCSRHGLPRLACCTQHSVHAEVHVGDDVAEQNDLHETARIRNGVFTGSEEIKNGVEEDKTDNGKTKTDDKVQRHCVAKNLFSRQIIFLS